MREIEREQAKEREKEREKGGGGERENERESLLPDGSAHGQVRGLRQFCSRAHIRGASKQPEAGSCPKLIDFCITQL